MQPDNLTDIHLGEFADDSGHVEGHQVHCRHKAADYDTKVVKTARFGEGTDKIHCNGVPGTCQDQQAVQESRHVLIVGLHHLTDGAHLIIPLDVLADLQPPVVAADIIHSLL